MRHLKLLVFMALFLVLPLCAMADQRSDPREQAISDTLDLWREGAYDKLYDMLSHRNTMTRESFVDQMKDAQIRPSCCHKKLNDFKLINEKKGTAKVYARIGIEGVGSLSDTKSREYTLDHENGIWKMRLADIKSLAGVAKKKKSGSTKIIKKN